MKHCCPQRGATQVYVAQDYTPTRDRDEGPGWGKGQESSAVLGSGEVNILAARRKRKGVQIPEAHFREDLADSDRKLGVMRHISAPREPRPRARQFMCYW